MSGIGDSSTSLDFGSTDDVQTTVKDDRRDGNDRLELRREIELLKVKLLQSESGSKQEIQHLSSKNQQLAEANQRLQDKLHNDMMQVFNKQRALEEKLEVFRYDRKRLKMEVENLYFDESYLRHNTTLNIESMDFVEQIKYAITSKVRNFVKENQNLKSINMDRAEEIVRLKNQVEEFNSSIKLLEFQLSEEKMRIQTYEDKLKNCVEKNFQIISYEQLKKDHSDTMEKLHSVMDEKAQLEKRDGQVTEELKNSSLKCEALENTIRLLKDEAKHRDQQLMSARSQLLVCSEIETKLRSEIESIRSSREDLVQKLLKVANESASNATKQSMNEVVKQIKQDTDSRFEELADKMRICYEMKLSTLQSRYDYILQERDSLTQQIEHVKSKHDESVAILRTRLDASESKVADMTSQLSVKSFQLDRSRAVAEQLEKQLDIEKDQNTKNRRKVDIIGAELASCQVELEICRREQAIIGKMGRAAPAPTPTTNTISIARVDSTQDDNNSSGKTKSKKTCDSPRKVASKAKTIDGIDEKRLGRVDELETELIGVRRALALINEPQRTIFERLTKLEVALEETQRDNVSLQRQLSESQDKCALLATDLQALLAKRYEVNNIKTMLVELMDGVIK